MLTFKYLVLCCIIIINVLSNTIQEIFRENLLPSSGGKIPEYAFKPERLSLNQLEQQGFFNEEGFLWNHIRPGVRYPCPTPTIKVSVGSRNYWKILQIVDTTYSLREPISFAFLFPNVTTQRCIPIMPIMSIKLSVCYGSFKTKLVQKMENDWKKSLPALSTKILEKLARYL